MRSLFSLAFTTVALLAAAAPARAADKYDVDPVHSTSVFRLKHANIAWFYGRFTEPTGSFVLDEADLSKSSFTIELAVDKVDTAQPKRDAHIKSPDYFNAKQYPKITFKSTSVKKGDDNMLEVTGDLTMHGVTKQVRVPVEMTGKGEFPPASGSVRAGVEARLKIKMSDFEIKGVPGTLSDEVTIMVSLEGVKQK